MTQQIPQHVFERLEREWRLMEPERKPEPPKPILPEPLPRLRVGRYD